MNPVVAELLIQLGITLEKPVEEFLVGVFTRNPQEEENAQLHLIRALGDKRAAEKFGPLPASGV